MRLAAACMACLAVAGCASSTPEPEPLTAEEYRVFEEQQRQALSQQLDSILEQQRENLREQEHRLESLEHRTTRIMARLREIDVPRREGQGEDADSEENPESADLALDQEILSQDLPLVFGAHECVAFPEQGLVLRARVDSGANTASLNARDIREFERDGEPWVRFRMGKPPGDEDDEENGEDDDGENGDTESGAAEILDNVMALVDESLEDEDTESGEAAEEDGEADAGERGITDVEVEARVVRRLTIRQTTGNEQRVVVELPVRIGPLSQQVEFSLTDRGDMSFPVLLGRRLLMDVAVIDVGEEYVQQCPVDR